MNQRENSAPDAAHAAQSPVVLCVAPNGARRTKKDHTGLPMTADELGRAAAACADAGASVIHLHVRNEQGVQPLICCPTWRPGILRTLGRCVLSGRPRRSA